MWQRSALHSPETQFAPFQCSIQFAFESPTREIRLSLVSGVSPCSSMPTLLKTWTIRRKRNSLRMLFDFGSTLIWSWPSFRYFLRTNKKKNRKVNYFNLVYMAIIHFTPNFLHSISVNNEWQHTYRYRINSNENARVYWECMRIMYFV